MVFKTYEPSLEVKEVVLLKCRSESTLKSGLCGDRGRSKISDVSASHTNLVLGFSK